MHTGVKMAALDCVVRAKQTPIFATNQNFAVSVIMALVFNKKLQYNRQYFMTPMSLTFIPSLPKL